MGVNWFLNKFVKLTGQCENITFGAPVAAIGRLKRGVFTRVQFAF